MYTFKIGGRPELKHWEMASVWRDGYQYKKRPNEDGGICYWSMSGGNVVERKVSWCIDSLSCQRGYKDSLSCQRQTGTKGNRSVYTGNLFQSSNCNRKRPSILLRTYPLFQFEKLMLIHYCFKFVWIGRGSRLFYIHVGLILFGAIIAYFLVRWALNWGYTL